MVLFNDPLNSLRNTPQMRIGVSGRGGWGRAAASGSIRTHPDPSGSIRILPDPSGSIRTHPDPSGSIRTANSSILEFWRLLPYFVLNGGPPSDRKEKEGAPSNRKEKEGAPSDRK